MASAWSDSWSDAWGNAWGVITIGTAITNSEATISVPTHIEFCSRSGFKLYPDELVMDYYNGWVRKRSQDTRHPSELVSSTVDKQRGSVAPEPTERFLSVNEVSADDL